jgi:cytoskeletal protein RodZ
MKELGVFLRGEREKRQLALTTVSQETCISLSMLTALEEGDSSKIGTPLLIRSFTRAYCRVLGVDPVAVLERYTGEIPRHERLDEGIRKFRERSLAHRERRRLKLYLFLALLVAGGGIYVTNVWLPMRDKGLPELSRQSQNGLQPKPNGLMSERDASGPGEQKGSTESHSGARSEYRGEVKHTDPLPQTADTAPAVPPASDVGHQVAPPAEAPVQQGNLLRVEALQETWVEVRMGDNQVEGVLLAAGEKRDWATPKGLRLLIGNAGGVKVWWNGKAVRGLGRPGQVVRLRLPEDLKRP